MRSIKVRGALLGVCAAVAFVAMPLEAQGGSCDVSCYHITDWGGGQSYFGCVDYNSYSGYSDCGTDGETCSMWICGLVLLQDPSGANLGLRDCEGKLEAWRRLGIGAEVAAIGRPHVDRMLADT